MGGGSIFPLFICITLFLGINGELTHREALQIIIGGGGVPPSPPPEIQDCPPPPPPPPPICPPPPPPPSPPSPSPSPPPPSPSPPSPPSPPPPSPSPSPSPPPPKPPKPPSAFESPRLKLVYPVLIKFKAKVEKYDPKGKLKTWTGTDICHWAGLRCDIVPDFQQKALAGVKFNNFNFGGPDLKLTEFLDDLPDIAFFHANSNNFTGDIPTSIGKLRYLFELDLSNNKFTGKFPMEVLSATKLVFLDLRFNTLSGVVPPQVFRLDLDLLFINNNNFVQKLPDNLGSTPVLYLTLANNKFIGGIPPSIGQASETLQEVLFLNNQLTGCLPYEIGFLKKATVFDVGLNKLTGPIPHSFQCLKSMQLLNLAQNRFYGVVPEPVCSLPHLSNFTISYNYFTQVGPQCRKLIKKGTLHVKMNCILDLRDQRSPSDCANFFTNNPRPCPNEKSLSFVPCSHGYSRDELKSSYLQSTAPAPAPQGRSYGALSPH